jgi:hypothetical protein
MQGPVYPPKVRVKATDNSNTTKDFGNVASTTGNGKGTITITGKVITKPKPTYAYSEGDNPVTRVVKRK